MIINPYIFNPGGGSPGGCAGVSGTTSTFINGTGTNLHYVPVSGYYGYSIAFFLLTAAELNTSKEFTGLLLEKAFTEPSGITLLNQTVKFYHTASPVLPGTVITAGTFGSNLTLVGANPGLPVTDETTVFNGNWYQTAASGWKEMIFNQDNFCYNGVDNVVVMWINDDGAPDLTNYPFWKTDSESSSIDKGAYAYSDSAGPTSASNFDQRPHLQLSY